MNIEPLLAGILAQASAGQGVSGRWWGLLCPLDNYHSNMLHLFHSLLNPVRFDAPNSWVSVWQLDHFAGSILHHQGLVCGVVGHSEEQGTPYMGGQVTNSPPGKPAHLINLCLQHLPGLYRCRRLANAAAVFFSLSMYSNKSGFLLPINLIFIWFEKCRFDILCHPLPRLKD